MDEIKQKEEVVVENNLLGNSQDNNVELVKNKPKMSIYMLLTLIFAICSQIALTIMFLCGVSECFSTKTSVIGVLNLILGISSISIESVLKVGIAVLFVAVAVICIKAVFTTVNNLIYLNSLIKKQNFIKASYVAQSLCEVSLKISIWISIFVWVSTIVKNDAVRVEGIICVVLLCLLVVISSCLLNFKACQKVVDKKQVLDKWNFVFVVSRNLFIALAIVLFFSVFSKLSLIDIWFGIEALFMGTILNGNFFISLSNLYNLIIRDILFLGVLIRLLFLAKSFRELVLFEEKEIFIKQIKSKFINLEIFLFVIIFIFGLTTIISSSSLSSTATVKTVLSQVLNLSSMYFAGLLILVTCHLNLALIEIKKSDSVKA